MDRLSGAAKKNMLEYYSRCRHVHSCCTVQHASVLDCNAKRGVIGREAEQYRAEEQQAAVVLQACWRGCLQRHHLEKLRCAAECLLCNRFCQYLCNAGAAACDTEQLHIHWTAACGVLSTAHRFDAHLQALCMRQRRTVTRECNSKHAACAVADW